MLVLAALLVASNVQAQMPNLEPWQEKAMEKVFEYHRIEKAQWNTLDQFMLHSSSVGIAWKVVIEDLMCRGLFASIGKPEGHEFVVSVYHTDTNDFLGIARCR
ncbi:hypothetical protein [Pseudovibrio sp. Tun.PSC04-5.I4]|uniref:hypothetical protein n=1 Tax=Pseudovibrio sp. Tun.PSC04-5.I4 TaxID=1798213 RepID=UPI001179B722|nr:hypothetical protein [Pseudovibrio sp. Tun.PSC04-5.I4]